MAGDGTLNRLVSELSLEERNNLLEKLKGQSTISPEPLYEEAEEGSAVTFDEQYIKLPWYMKLYYVIVSLFRNKAPLKVFEDSRIGSLGRQIEAQAPGIYDYQRNYLLYEFFRLLSALRDGARFFFTALDASVNRDKGEFYAFLGSLEMPEVHRHLIRNTSPEAIAERSPGVGEPEMRQIAFKAMEDAIAEISDQQRNAMYFDARSLNCLKELSSFLFDRVLVAFGFEPSAGGQVCSANVVREQLITLNNLLCSLRESPPLALLESLFVFVLQDRTAEQGFDINQEMRNLLSKAEISLAAIRTFNQQVPLTLILRCAGRDMSLVSRTISGGEEWFAVYREYWKRHIEALFAEYMRNRRHMDLIRSFGHFFKGTNLKVLGNTMSESNPNGLPITEAFALSFLLTFYSAVFMRDINKFLRPILLDGEFIKRENRTEFTENYNDLIKLEDDIRRFEANISRSGDLGKRYSQACGEMSSLPIKRRKIQMVLEEASTDAAEIIDRSRKAIKTLIKVTNGILKSDGRYESLSNLDKLADKGQAQAAFLNGLSDTAKSLQKTLDLMDDIDAMENRRN
ncbi:MAG: DUF5312 domain-containing protein [Treponema sp.]|jgi:hypothetical protein|nr:DUF5312 domain-containing protein [Treponema sp.]